MSSSQRHSFAFFLYILLAEFCSLLWTSLHMVTDYNNDTKRELPKRLSNTTNVKRTLRLPCYDLIPATLLYSPPCHGTPFPSPLPPVLAHSCISFCTCYLSRVHRLEISPLSLDSIPRMWSLLPPWLRIKEVRPIVPLTSSHRAAALRRCSLLPLASSLRTATFKRYTTIQICTS